MLKKWLIIGCEWLDIPDIIVVAESIDEALKAAREIDPRYIAGACMQTKVKDGKKK